MQQGAPDRVLQADGAGDVSSVCLVCEGVLAAASESGAVQLWDVRSGGVLRVLEGHAEEVWEVCMAADGVLASASEDGTCRLWRAASGECLHVLSHNHPAREYLVSCAGVASSTAASSAAAAAAALVATASSGRVRLWRVTDGALVHDLPTAAGDSVNCVAGAGVGVVASGCDSGAVRMWCALGGTCLRTIGVAGPVDSLRAVPCARGSGGTLLAVAFGGGEYAATGELGLYDASSGVRPVANAAGPCCRAGTGRQRWAASCARWAPMRLRAPGAGGCACGARAVASCCRSWRSTATISPVCAWWLRACWRQARPVVCGSWRSSRSTTRRKRASPQSQWPKQWWRWRLPRHQRRQRRRWRLLRQRQRRAASQRPPAARCC